MTIHDQDVTVNGFCFTCQEPKEEGVTHVCKTKLTPEDTKAISVPAAVGMLVTPDENKATRALNFLLGRLGKNALGWFYKEGYYNVLVIGKPEDYLGGEKYFHHLKSLLDTWLGTDVMLATVPMEAFQEVSL